jgi:3-mercaptopyruvate sulfurtransferase SseA
MLRSLLRQATSIALAGAAVGLAANALGPRPVPLGRPVHAAAEASTGACNAAGAEREPAPRIRVEEAKALCDGCHAAFVDARGPGAYAAGHVTGAIHLPPAGHPESPGAIAALRGAPMVIVYDGDYSCALADEVADRLRREGLPDVRVLEGAWPAWLAANGPGAAGACPTCGEVGGASHAPEESRP